MTFMYRIILSNNNFATQIHKYETKADIADMKLELSVGTLVL